MKNLVRCLLFFSVCVCGVSVWGTPNQFTYQGRILSKNNIPLEYNNVSFQFEITSPNGQCILFREQVDHIDMTSSGGTFDVPIGSGARSFPSGAGFTLSDAFNNSDPLNCDGGTLFTPSSNSIRLLRVQFRDQSGWNLITPDSEIRSVPFSAYSYSAERLGSNPVAAFVLKSEINNNVSCGGGGSFLTWDAVSKTFGCSGVGGSSGGTVTNITSINSYLSVGGDNVSPALTVNVGQVANTVAAGNDARFTDSRIPKGAAAGDLSGSYPNPSVAKIQGVDVANATPSSGQVLRYDGAKWIAANLSTSDITGTVGTVTNVTGNAPIVVSNGNSTPSISVNDATASSKGVVQVGAGLSVGAGVVSVNPSTFSSTVPVSKGGTGVTSFVANGVIVSGATGTSLASLNCGLGQIISFDATGAVACSNLSSSGAFVNGGNSFGIDASLGTNDNKKVSLITNGSTAMTISTTGNVGVGTTAPTHPLNVVTAIALDRYGGNSPHLVLRGAGGTVAAPTSTTSGAGIGKVSGNSWDGSSWASASGIDMTATENATTTNRGSDLSLFTTPNGSTTSVSRLYISNGGNIGMGTMSPAYKLDIAGDVGLRSASALRLFNSDNSSQAAISNGGDPGAGATARLDFYTTPTPAMSITTAGNVGVGTTNPIGGFHVKTSPVTWSANNYGAGVVIDGARNNALAILDYSSSNPWALANVSGDMAFATMPSLTDSTTGAGVRFILKRNGNVGIGTVSPIVTLDMGANKDAIRLPSGATSDQPLAAAGLLRFNTTTNTLEFNDGVNWIAVSASAGGSNISSGSSGAVTIAAGGTNQNVTLQASGLGVVTSSSMMTLTSGQASTSSSSGALVVSGGVGVSGALNAGGNIYSGGNVQASSSIISPIIYGSTSASGTLTLDSTSNSTKGNVLIAPSGGNVGIGTTFPNITGAGTALTILGASTNRGSLELGSTTATSTTVFGQVAGYNGGTFASLIQFFGDGAADSGAIKFFTKTSGGAISEKVRFDSAGNVGIGTTSPSTMLDIVSNTTNPSIEIYGPTVNNFAPFLSFKGARSAGTAYPQTSDYLGVISFRNQNNGQAAAIASVATENHTATAAGGNLMFNTTPNGSVGNTTRMLIDQNGNIGIGTTSPLTKMDINGIVKQGSSFLQNVFHVNVGSDARWETGANKNLLKIKTNLASVDTVMPMIHIYGTDYASGSSMDLRINFYYFSGAWSAYSVSSAGGYAPAVSLGVESGEVSILLSRSSGDRWYYGDFQIDAQDAMLASSNISSYTGWTFSDEDLSTASQVVAVPYKLQINNNLVVSGGNIGIGTTNPASPLHVSTLSGGADVMKLEIPSTGYVGAIGMHMSAYNSAGVSKPYGGVYGYVDSPTSGSESGGVVFYGRNSGVWGEKVRITGNGKVGIGTGAPMAPLEINDTNGTAAILYIGDSNTANSTGLYVNRWASGTNPMGIQGTKVGVGSNDITLQAQGGRVGIGTTSPGYALDINGDVNASGCVRGGGSVLGGVCSSDERLKTEIQPFELGLQALLEINPKFFKYNGLGGHPASDKLELGVIAQEVEKAAPQLVVVKQVKLHSDDTELTEIKQVNYSAFTYVIINAVKEIYSKFLAHDKQLASQARQIASKADRSELEFLKAENQKLKSADIAKTKELEVMKARLDRIERALPSK